MTYGELRFRVSKLLPGIDHDLLDGWISDRYAQILDAIAWQRRDIRAVIQTAAIYQTGEVTLTSGSATVTGTGTEWDTGQTGMGFAVTGRNEFYEFAFTGATSAQLDRPFEGPTGTYSYKLFQSVYPLPDDCKILKSVVDLQTGQQLTEHSEANAPVVLGLPATYRKLMDDLSDPPRMQIELLPTPEGLRSLSIEYTAEERVFGSTTATTLLPWLRPGCLVAGVEADGLVFLEKFEASDRKEARFQVLLGDMIRTAAANIPAKRIRLSAEFKPSSPTLYKQSTRKNQMP